MLERREGKGRVAALASPQPVPPCSSSFIQEIHEDPAWLLLTACVLPSLAAGCGFGSPRPDCCCLNGSCLCLPRSCAPAIAPTLPWPGWQEWLCCGVTQLQHSCPHCWEVLGCCWSCSPVTSSLLNRGTPETCKTQAGFMQAELAAIPSSWQGGKLQQDKRGGPNPAMAD